MAKNKQSTKKPINTQCIGDNADLCATAELIRNGGPIDWRYWSARREITPQEAAKLAHCIDPIQWPNDQHAQGPILNDLHIKIQRLAALLAERNQKWTLIALAAMLGNNAPLFMREIANLAQRAGDRCNAGIQASKAPPPMTLVGNTPFKLPQFDTNVKGSPNWKHWRHVSTVEIWQGLLLSLNIGPPGNGWLIDNAVGGTGDIPYEYLDSQGLTDEFIRRWKLVRNRLETLYASMGSPCNAELTNFLRLPLFAAWAVGFEWSELPPELVALAQSSDKQTDAPAARPHDNTSVNDGTRVAKTGRPPEIARKAEILRQIIIAAEQVAGKQFTPAALPGNADDLLAACKRIEKALTDKILLMEASTETFKGWLRKAGYSFPNGRAPKGQETFWTHIAPKTTGKINAGVFTAVIPGTPL